MLSTVYKTCHYFFVSKKVSYRNATKMEMFTEMEHTRVRVESRHLMEVSSQKQPWSWVTRGSRPPGAVGLPETPPRTEHPEAQSRL